MQVEITKLDTIHAAGDGSIGGGGGSSCTIRACIAKVPRGYPMLVVDQLTDQVWGQDGFDT